MPVDARITSVETEMTARDPSLADDPLFIAKIVASVLEEIKRAKAEDERRESDRRASRTGGR